MLADQQGLERGGAVAWNFNGQLTKVALERLLAVAIAGVARLVGNQLVLAVAQVVRHLGLQCPLDQRFGQLLQEAALAYQVFGFFVVRQQYDLAPVFRTP